MAFGGFLVRAGDRVGLIDAGIGPESPTPFMSGGQLLNSLAEHHVSPGEITDMIFTHLHFDHIGWASRAGEAVFPNATYRCDERDWEYFVEPPAELGQACGEDNPDGRPDRAGERPARARTDRQPPGAVEGKHDPDARRRRPARQRAHPR